jgi:hypothetical protein
VDTPPPTTEVALDASEETKLDARLKTDERGLPVGRLTPPVSVSPGMVTVLPGSSTETPIPLPEGLVTDVESVGLIEMETTGELLGLMMVGNTTGGNTTELKVGNWPLLIEVDPCLMPVVAEETGIEPRETELLAGLIELLAGLTELTGLTELLAGLTELTGLTELLAGLTELTGFTELLGFAETLELLTAGLLELFKVGSEIGSLNELLDLVETLALLVAGLLADELGFFEDEEELDFLLEEGNFADEEEIFLLEVTGLTVTVVFLVVTGAEEAILVGLVNFKMLEKVSLLLEMGLMLETGLTAVDALELLVTFLELLVTFLELLLTFLELIDTLMGETFGMEKVV